MLRDERLTLYAVVETYLQNLEEPLTNLDWSWRQVAAEKAVGSGCFGARNYSGDSRAGTKQTMKYWGHPGSAYCPVHGISLCR